MTLYNSSNKTWICANPVERIVVAERLLWFGVSLLRGARKQLGLQWTRNLCLNTF
jgi:hypothetical protein